MSLVPRFEITAWDREGYLDHSRSGRRCDIPSGWRYIKDSASHNGMCGRYKDREGRIYSVRTLGEHDLEY